jgi:hypothetical protein
VTIYEQKLYYKNEIPSDPGPRWIYDRKIPQYYDVKRVSLPFVGGKKFVMPNGVAINEKTPYIHEVEGETRLLNIENKNDASDFCYQNSDYAPPDYHLFTENTTELDALNFSQNYVNIGRHLSAYYDYSCPGWSQGVQLDVPSGTQLERAEAYCPESILTENGEASAECLNRVEKLCQRVEEVAGEDIVCKPLEDEIPPFFQDSAGSGSGGIWALVFSMPEAVGEAVGRAVESITGGETASGQVTEYEGRFKGGNCCSITETAAGNTTGLGCQINE